MSIVNSLGSNADGDGNGQVTLGDVLTISIQLTNTGALTLTNPTYTDPHVGLGAISCSTPSLPSGAVLDCGSPGPSSWTYTVTAADVSAGVITFTVSATSVEVPGPLTSVLNIPVFPSSPGMSVSKVLAGNSDPDSSGTVTQGDVLTYTVTASNTGNIVLTNVTVNDPLTSPNTTTCSSVPVSGTCVLTGTYTVTASDAANGSISNTGSATSTEVAGPINSSLTTPAAGNPGMSVSKLLAGNSDPDASGTVSQGDVLTYSVTASNTGNVALTNVTVNDALTTPSATSCPNVPVGGACVLTGTYTVTASDVANGTISNVGSASSTQVPGPINSATVNTPVAAPNGSLTIVSGDNQLLVGSTPSAPLVVQLNNSSNAPVVGATINWTATKGTLASATSVTDATGRAENTVTATSSGPVTVQASSVLAINTVTFNLSIGLATISGLTPEEQSVAGALDLACPALSNQGSLTPEQADLLARCLELNAAASLDGGATADALGELVAQSAQVQSNAAVTASVAQFQNITLRLAALRSSSTNSSLSSNSSSLGGLTFAGPGGLLPLGSLMQALLGEAETKNNEVGAGFSRWGFFATGTIGRGTADARSTTPGYDYDITGLTAGVDYRQRDNWVSGAAVGFSRQTTDLDHDRGDVALTGWSVSTYSTWSFKNNLYLDGVLTWGRNQFDMNRRIDYTLPTPGGGTTTVHQIANGQPDGDLFSAALSFGGDFYRKEWNFSPYAQVISSRIGFDAYQEELLAGAGNGLGLSVDARTINTLSSVLGAKVSWTHSADWGVLIPTASFEWQHEYKADLQAITARFANDPTQTTFSLTGVPLDDSFFRAGVGFSVVLPHGRSGFVLYEHMLGRQGMTQDNLGLGIRIEF